MRITNELWYKVLALYHRHKQKGGIEDLRKAKHYLEFLAEIEYGERL